MYYCIFLKKRSTRATAAIQRKELADLAALLECAAKYRKKTGFTPILIPFSEKDREISRRAAKLLGGVFAPVCLEGSLKLISGAQAVFSMRYHPALFSRALGRKTAVFSHDPKLYELKKQNATKLCTKTKKTIYKNKLLW